VRNTKRKEKKEKWWDVVRNTHPLVDGSEDRELAEANMERRASKLSLERIIGSGSRDDDDIDSARERSRVNLLYTPFVCSTGARKNQRKKERRKGAAHLVVLPYARKGSPDPLHSSRSTRPIPQKPRERNKVRKTKVATRCKGQRSRKSNNARSQLVFLSFFFFFHPLPPLIK
jgi:hypothetical protein